MHKFAYIGAGIALAGGIAVFWVTRTPEPVKTVEVSEPRQEPVQQPESVIVEKPVQEPVAPAPAPVAAVRVAKVVDSPAEKPVVKVITADVYPTSTPEEIASEINRNTIRINEQEQRIKELQEQLAQVPTTTNTSIVEQPQVIEQPSTPPPPSDTTPPEYEWRYLNGSVGGVYQGKFYTINSDEPVSVKAYFYQKRDAEGKLLPEFADVTGQALGTAIVQQMIRNFESVKGALPSYTGGLATHHNLTRGSMLKGESYEVFVFVSDASGNTKSDIHELTW